MEHLNQLICSLLHSPKAKWFRFLNQVFFLSISRTTELLTGTKASWIKELILGDTVITSSIPTPRSVYLGSLGIRTIYSRKLKKGFQFWTSYMFDEEGQKTQQPKRWDNNKDGDNSPY